MVSSGICRSVSELAALCADTWEYPPAAAEGGSSPRPKGNSVYVPREPIGKHSPSNTDADSPLTTLKSRLGPFSAEPIPELAHREGSACSNTSLGSAEEAALIKTGLLNAEQSSAPNGQLSDAASDSSTPGDTKQQSALSAALSGASEAVSSQDGHADQSEGAIGQVGQAVHALPAADSGALSTAGSQRVERAGQHSAPRSIPGSGGRQVGMARQLRAEHCAGLSARPAGVNSASGTALFWTGSQAHGIAFADDSPSNYSEPRSVHQADEGAKELSRSPNQAGAEAYGMVFEDSERSSSTHHDSCASVAINGVKQSDEDVNGGVQERSSSAERPSAKQALAERAEEDDQQYTLSDIAAAAAAEVDAENDEHDKHESMAPQRAQPATSLSGELPPGEQLSEQGSVDEERPALGVSPVGFMYQPVLLALLEQMFDPQSLDCALNFIRTITFTPPGVFIFLCYHLTKTAKVQPYQQ